MENTPPPDLRPFLTRLWARILHIPREPPPCAHCHHVVQLETTVKAHNKLLWLVAGAIVGIVIKWAAADISARLRWVDPGAPASLVGSDPRK